MTAVREVSTVEELADLVEIRDVVILEQAGKRHDGFADEVDPPTNVAPMQVFRQLTDEQIQVRCRMTLVGAESTHTMDVAAVFSLTEPLSAPDAILREFDNRVAVPLVFPYLRWGLQETAFRLRVPAPVLGLYRPNAPDPLDQRDDEAVHE